MTYEEWLRVVRRLPSEYRQEPDGAYVRRYGTSPVVRVAVEVFWADNGEPPGPVVRFTRSDYGGSIVHQWEPDTEAELFDHLREAEKEADRWMRAKEVTGQ